MNSDVLVNFYVASISFRKILPHLGISLLSLKESKFFILKRVQVDWRLSLGNIIHEYWTSELLQHKKADIAILVCLTV